MLMLGLAIRRVPSVVNKCGNDAVRIHAASRGNSFRALSARTARLSSPINSGLVSTSWRQATARSPGPCRPQNDTPACGDRGQLPGQCA